MIVLFHIVQIAVCFMFIGWALGRIMEIKERDREIERRRKAAETPERREAWRRDIGRMVDQALNYHEVKK